MARIDYFYSAHSAYAYLGAQTLYRMSADHGVALIHRPFLLSPVVEAAGGLSFADRTQGHVDYFFGREIERWAEWRNVPVVPFRPTHHDAPYDLANRLIIAAGQGADALSFVVLQAHWRNDADLSDEATLEKLVRQVGLDARDLMAIADRDETRQSHDANTAHAIKHGFFGSPTYVVEGEVFYGQDHLEMVERALSRPFAPSRWRNPPVAVGQAES